MKPKYKPWIPYSLFFVLTAFSAWACVAHNDYSASTDLLICAVFGCVAGLASVIPMRPYRIARSHERLLELTTNVNQRFLRTDDQTPITVMSVEWDEGKIYAFVDLDKDQIRISEKWLYKHANKQQRYFLMRWCCHFRGYKHKGASTPNAEMLADQCAFKDCEQLNYNINSIYYFCYDAFAYPNRLTTDRISGLQTIVNMWRNRPQRA